MKHILIDQDILIDTEGREKERHLWQSLDLMCV
jgi:hypothetical protein